METKAFDDIDMRRMVANLIRPGKITEVDLAKARVRVQAGKNTTAWLPWLSMRAGANITWWAPQVNEQVVLLSPGGDMSQAIAIVGLYSATFPAPSADPDVALMKFSDEALISYNTTTHALKAELPAGGTALLKADGGITLDGPTHITGTLTCDMTVDAADTITSAADVVDATSSMQTMRDTYNDHTKHNTADEKPVEKME